jgi:hypothetical protein
MNRKTLLVLTLGALTASAVPARADLQSIFEPFNDTFSARTFHVQREGGRKNTILLGGEYQMFDTPQDFTSADLENRIYRGGVGFATSRFQLGVAAGNIDLESGPFDFGDFFMIEVHGKYVVWNSKSGKTSAAIAAQWRDIDDQFRRIDALVAIDHRLGRDVIGTINAGWANVKVDGAEDDDSFVGSAGIAINPARFPRWTLALEYMIESDANLMATNPSGGNWFSGKLTYRAGHRLDLYVGGGDDKRVLGGARVRL